MNIVELFGHLGADPETRFTPSGQKVTALRIATNARVSGADVTTWWQVSFFGEHPLLQYFKKGSAIIVVGEMTKARTYADKNGVTQVALDVRAEMIKFPPFGNKEKGNQQPQQPQQKVSTGYAEPSNFSATQQPVAAGNEFGFGHEEEEEPLPF